MHDVAKVPAKRAPEMGEHNEEVLKELGFDARDRRLARKRRYSPEETTKEDPMLSQFPIDLSKVKPDDLDKEILRAAIIGELDTINFYEQMAALAKNTDIRKVLLDIAREEKTHVGEFQTMLLRLDAEQVKELEHGKEEVKELTGK